MTTTGSEVPAGDIVVTATAHPRARKFVLVGDLNTGAPVTFRRAAECDHIPLAFALFAEPGVTELHFVGNVLMVLRERDADWEDLEKRVLKVLKAQLPGHDPAMPRPLRTPEAVKRSGQEYLVTINAILDQTIRPYLHSHGGELELISYDAGEQQLTVSYRGTCGTCPASTDGTLQLIESILHDEFDPRIKIEIME